MSKVYVFGPIHLFGKDYIPFYKQVNELCKNYFGKVMGTYPDFWDTKETPQQFYKRTRKSITKADLFIAEVSSPSVGVGMELQMAQEYEIPVIAVCRRETKPSTMVLGIPCVQKIIFYKNIPGLLKRLKVEFEKKKY